MSTVEVPTAGLWLVICLVGFAASYAGALRAGFEELEKTFILCLVLAAGFGIGTGLSFVFLFV